MFEPLFTTVDDDGFVCLVVSGSYRSFIGDWTLDLILARFVEEMNRGAAFVAFPGPDAAHARVHIVPASSDLPAVREISGILHSTDDAGIHATDYTQLTMAAQFDDERPARARDVLPLQGGSYRVTLRELVGPAPSFELAIEADDSAEQVHHNAVPWFG